MSNLQEVITVLLGAEAEAKRTVEQASKDAESSLRAAQEDFRGKRAAEMETAHKQVNEIMQAAKSDAHAEAAQITETARAERESLMNRFNRSADAVTEAVALEIAEGYKRKAGF